MYLTALYAAYLGVGWYDRAPGKPTAPGLALQAPAGSGMAALSYHGRMLQLSVRGTGPLVRVAIGGQTDRTPILPGPLLCAGCMVDVAWRR